MIQKKGKPISAGRGQFRPTPNVLSDSADTSRDAQKLVKAPPAPMQNRQNAMNIPAPSHPYYKVGSDFSKQGLKYGGIPKSVSVHNAPTVNLAAVGEPRLPKGYNSIMSGFPTRGVARTAGKISTNAGPAASAKEMKRIRQTYPGIMGRSR